MDSFKIMFLDFQWLGCLWSAVDPIEEDSRWVIRRPTMVTPVCAWEMGYTMGTNFYDVAKGKDPHILGFMAVSQRIQQICYSIERNPELGPEKIAARKLFLHNLHTIYESMDTYTGTDYSNVGTSEEGENTSDRAD